MGPEIVFAVPIVAIVVGGVTKMVSRGMKLEEKRIEMMGAQTAESAAQYAAKTERLEQRVAVLERLLTDRSTQLADEIDRLRDQPLN